MSARKGLFLFTLVFLLVSVSFAQDSPEIPDPIIPQIDVPEQDQPGTGEPEFVSPIVVPPIDAVEQKLNSRIDSQLHALVEAVELYGLATATASSQMQHMKFNNDMVLIDAIAQTDANALLIELQTLGLQHGSVYGRVVSGYLPIFAIKQLSNSTQLNIARSSAFKIHAGDVTSQAVDAHAVVNAWDAFGVTGWGVKVGVLSDSFDCRTDLATTYADDVASGDLPSVDIILDMASQCSDEGRAMAQLIYDVAPNVDLAFHSAAYGQAGFANGITSLAFLGGADVIVDDVIYFAEPMFADGPIAQAANMVHGQGIPYFSSAGNNARQSYESDYRPTGIVGDSVYGGELHDFDPGPGVDTSMRVTIPVGEQVIISFQWSEPYASTGYMSPGSASDVDIFLRDPSGTYVASSASGNVGRDPIEVLGFYNNGSYSTTQFDIEIELYYGPAPELMKFVWFDNNGTFSINEYGTDSSTIYGHANAYGAIAVGAAFYQDTPVFGQDPPLLEPFSSAGGTPILFDNHGNYWGYWVQDKPEIVAVDGTNTTFFIPGLDVEGDGFSNFFGTSAAAPHAAAIAALMMEGNRYSVHDYNLGPWDIEWYMQMTTIDMETPGFDYDSGYGFVNAFAAVDQAIPPDPRMILKNPGAFTYVDRPFQITGWALDLQAGAWNGPGIETIYIYDWWDFLNSGLLTVNRPGVSSRFSLDSSYDVNGFKIPIGKQQGQTGEYTYWVYAYDAYGQYVTSRTRTIYLKPEIRGALRAPSVSANVSTTFNVVGWTLDIGAGYGNGPGVDRVRVMQGTSCYGTNLGHNALTVTRTGISDRFGLDSSYDVNGFNFEVTAPGTGTLTFTTCAHSDVTGNWYKIDTRTVNVQ